MILNTLKCQYIRYTKLKLSNPAMLQSVLLSEGDNFPDRSRWSCVIILDAVDCAAVGLHGFMKRNTSQLDTVQIQY